METKKTGMLYKILSTVSIVGLFLTVGILATGLVQGYLNGLTALILAIFTILKMAIRKNYSFIVIKNIFLGLVKEVLIMAKQMIKTLVYCV